MDYPILYLCIQDPGQSSGSETQQRSVQKPYISVNQRSRFEQSESQLLAH